MQELEERERKLYGRCVRLMVWPVEGSLEYEPGGLIRNGVEYPLPVPYWYHYHRSDLEDYALLLERLGILIPLVDPPGHACYFKLAYSSAEAETIAYDCAATGPPLQRLLASLFYFAADKRGMTEEIGVEFPLDCYVQSIMQDMCDLGYAVRTGSGYAWLPLFRSILASPPILGRSRPTQKERRTALLKSLAERMPRAHIEAFVDAIVAGRSDKERLKTIFRDIAREVYGDPPDRG